MKTVATASGPTLDAAVDPRFARCSYFLFVDPETETFEALENTGEAESGAGIKAAQRFRDDKIPHHRFRLADPEHGMEVSDSVEVHAVELTKYNL